MQWVHTLPQNSTVWSDAAAYSSKGLCVKRNYYDFKVMCVPLSFDETFFQSQNILPEAFA